MKVHSSTDQDGKQQPLESNGRSPLTMLLVALNAFVLGGCLAFLIVNRLLANQLEVYLSSENMVAGSTMLDLMDDILPFYFLCGTAVVLILLLSATFWAWTRTQSSFLRYGTIGLLLLLIVFLVGFWFLGASNGAIPPPHLATPTPVSS